MATLNTLVCLGAIGNTGVGTCNYTDAPIRDAILIPKGETITAANAVDFKTYIESKLVLNDPNLRWRRIGAFRSFEEAGREEQTEVLDDGYKLITSDPTESTIYTIIGSSCTGKNLIDFDQQQDLFDVLYIDKNGIMLGQQYYNSTTNQMEIAGYTLDLLSVKVPTKATYTAATKFRVEFGHIDPKADYKNRAVIDCSNFRLPILFNTFAVQNVALAEATVSAVAGTHVITAVASCGNANLGTTFPTLLNDVDRWAMTTAAGVAKTITSVTIAANGNMTFVIDTPGAAGTVYYLNTSGVTDWSAEGMNYFENQYSLQLTIVA